MTTIFTSLDNSHNICLLHRVGVLFEAWSNWPRISNVTPQILFTYFLCRIKSWFHSQYLVRYFSILAMRIYINHSQGITLTTSCRMLLLFFYYWLWWVLCLSNVYSLVFLYGTRMPASQALACCSASRVYCTLKRKYLRYLSVWENAMLLIVCMCFYPFLIRKVAPNCWHSLIALPCLPFQKPLRWECLKWNFKFDDIMEEYIFYISITLNFPKVTGFSYEHLKIFSNFMKNVKGRTHFISWIFLEITVPRFSLVEPVISFRVGFNLYLQFKESRKHRCIFRQYKDLYLGSLMWKQEYFIHFKIHNTIL